MQFKAGLRRQQQQLPTKEAKQKQSASAIETTLQSKGSCKAEWQNEWILNSRVKAWEGLNEGVND